MHSRKAPGAVWIWPMGAPHEKRTSQMQRLCKNLTKWFKNTLDDNVSEHSQLRKQRSCQREGSLRGNWHMAQKQPPREKQESKQKQPWMVLLFSQHRSVLRWQMEKRRCHPVAARNRHWLGWPVHQTLYLCSFTSCFGRHAGGCEQWMWNMVWHRPTRDKLSEKEHAS